MDGTAILVTFYHDDCEWECRYNEETYCNCEVSNAVNFDARPVLFTVKSAVEDHLTAIHGDDYTFELIEVSFLWGNGKNGSNMLEMTEERRREQLQLAACRSGTCELWVQFKATKA